MGKSKGMTLVLVVILAVSLFFNIYQLISNLELSEQKAALTVRQEMVNQLMHTKINVDNELAKLDKALTSACQKLSSLGLDGTQVRVVLSDLVDENALIINAATADDKDILIAVEPSSYNEIEGQDISDQEQNIWMHESMLPEMSNMIPLVEGFPGVVMVAPIFDTNNKFMGSLSIVILPSQLINQSIAQPPEGTKLYQMWAMQSNGTLIYDPDPNQQGKNLLTAPEYAEYPEVQAFTQKVADQQSGYSCYQYYDKPLDDDTKKVVTKEAYWMTVGVYGTEWRLVIWNILNP
ncbi:MAG: hypothetical protein PHY74_05055 [Candidatus Bathyarchaeota archaeon]|nr:hypothetical protein [Candidatus Bathyarchaeota archaeon]MDD4325393.1 hypothetical protein [Candidatus Bathyarchaeota archaeon]MDI9578196.1 hypothetical protein [Thermoproteota archaeon]MDT8782706.1 cache domain-containing protein [Candidatus Bathyarchaeota archaeon]